MKNLFLLAFIILGGVAYGQQKTGSELKKESNEQVVTKEEAPVKEVQKIKTISETERRNLPVVAPGKKNASPVKKD